jgi:regulator of protease activity HflC (stomatin/prohibitin superfamily)
MPDELGHYVIDRHMEPWGTQVTAVEIKDITTKPSVCLKCTALPVSVQF